MLTVTGQVAAASHAGMRTRQAGEPAHPGEQLVGRFFHIPCRAGGVYLD
jgi:hypothetical protein